MATERAARQAVALGGAGRAHARRAGAAGLTRLHDEVERPLVRVLARMEVVGIRVDATALKDLADELAGEAAPARGARSSELAGEEFNVNSTPQLRTVLYERLGLAPGRKTKTGYSTDAATLERLRGQHPVVDALLRYREVEKLRSTYGESLLAEIADDGRIHASFNQTVARTGRLSSDRPNLHNIPVRTEEGRRLRRVFVPAEGCRLLIADYDQIELRVLAHVSGDPGLVSAFAEGRDIHRATAARVFGVAPEDVSVAQPHQRSLCADLHSGDGLGTIRRHRWPRYPRSVLQPPAAEPEPFSANPHGRPEPGVPADGKRDVPDIALNASNFHDAYLICSQNYFTTGSSTATSCTSAFRA